MSSSRRRTGRVQEDAAGAQDEAPDDGGIDGRDDVGFVADRRGDALAQVVDLGVVERDGRGHLDRQDAIVGGGELGVGGDCRSMQEAAASPSARGRRSARAASEPVEQLPRRTRFLASPRDGGVGERPHERTVPARAPR